MGNENTQWHLVKTNQNQKYENEIKNIKHISHEH